MSELPQDLITNILLRLPIKPICQFKCVSKAWRSLLSSPKFIRPHLEFHKDDPKQLIVTASWSYGFDPDYYIVTLTADETAGEEATAADDADSESSSDGGNREGVARKGQFPVKQKILLAGSCDGLVLLVLQDKGYSKILFNPITKESAKIVDNRDLVNSCTYGFGYDSSSEDYKIVSMSKLGDGNGSLVDVYSVKMKSWKRIGNSRYVLQNTVFPDEEKDPAPGVFLNGCIHWLGSATNPPNYGYEIVCFDLAREEFVEVPIAMDSVFKLARESFKLLIPNPGDRRVPFDISVIDGCLALALLPLNVANQWWHIHVWAMKEYGVRDSWTQIADMNGSYVDRGFVKIVCALDEDEVVVAVDRAQLGAYNMRNEGWRRLDIAAFPWDFHTVLPFRGSLLSPNKDDYFFG